MHRCLPLNLLRTPGPQLSISISCLSPWHFLILTPSFYSRNTEETRTMRGNTSQHHHQGSNGVRGMASPDRTAKGSGNGRSPATAALTEDQKGSSSGSEGNIWPKFAISLTNKEKEEDFLVFKGSKLPQRPKKRAKVVQRTINVSFFFLILL